MTLPNGEVVHIIDANEPDPVTLEPRGPGAVLVLADRRLHDEDSIALQVLNMRNVYKPWLSPMNRQPIGKTAYQIEGTNAVPFDLRKRTLTLLDPSRVGRQAGRLARNPDLAKVVLERNISAYPHLPETLQRDPAVVIPALMRPLRLVVRPGDAAHGTFEPVPGGSSALWQMLPTSLKQDPAFRAALYRADARVANCLEYDAELREFAQNPQRVAQPDLLPRLLGDSRLRQAILLGCPQCIEHLPKQVREAEDFALDAIAVARPEFIPASSLSFPMVAIAALSVPYLYDKLPAALLAEREFGRFAHEMNPGGLTAFLSHHGSHVNAFSLEFAAYVAGMPASQIRDRMLWGFDAPHALAAVTADPGCFEKLSPHLTESKIFVRDVVSRVPGIYRNLPEWLRASTKVAGAALARDPSLVDALPDVLRSGAFFSGVKAQIRARVEQDPSLYPDLPEVFRGSIAITRAAVERDGMSILHATSRAQTLANVRVAVSQNEAVRERLPESLRARLDAKPLLLSWFRS